MGRTRPSIWRRATSANTARVTKTACPFIILFHTHSIGNEPAHHAPWLFNAAGAPWLAQRAIDAVQRLYSADASGLPGNDDVGQTSAWLVFATLGLYPVDPCGGAYELSRPLFSDLEVDLGRGGRKLRVLVENPGPRHVAAVFWNGARRTQTTLPFEDLQGGGELRYRMGHSPLDWSSGSRVGSSP